MSECKHKGTDGICDRDCEFTYRGYCHEGPCTQYEPQTNADRIRAMSDEELAERIAALMACMDCPLLEKCEREEPRRCIDMWRNWLKSQVEEGEE